MVSFTRLVPVSGRAYSLIGWCFVSSLPVSSRTFLLVCAYANRAFLIVGACSWTELFFSFVRVEFYILTRIASLIDLIVVRGTYY